MAFYAKDFIFDGVMSQELGLTITSDSAEAESMASSDTQFIEQRIPRRPDSYVLGVNQSPVLSFPVSFNAERKIDAVFASIIGKTLFGQMEYKKLQVVAPDYEGYFWNCQLKSPTIKRVGNEIVGWNAVVTCKSPWAYSFPTTLYIPSKTTEFTVNTVTYPATGFATYNNRSGNSDYSKPKIIFKTSNSTNATVSITNQTDGRVFTFTGLSANETITVDNDLQIITSTLGLNRLGKFNYKWFRWVPGKNLYKITGQVRYVQFVNVDAQKIGG